jgi:hypothetical protein
MSNTYYYKNREERIQYQRNYRIKQKYRIQERKKYKKKPKEKTKIIIKKIIVNFD